jgi:ABC transporter substrate binding protein
VVVILFHLQIQYGEVKAPRATARRARGDRQERSEDKGPGWTFPGGGPPSTAGDLRGEGVRRRRRTPASYGPKFPDMYRRAPTYVDRILEGEMAGQLPMEQPTKFDFVINLKTAKALGLTLPPSLLLRADQVIE